jgi:hypothetical protein
MINWSINLWKTCSWCENACEIFHLACKMIRFERQKIKSRVGKEDSHPLNLSQHSRIDGMKLK